MIYLAQSPTTVLEPAALTRVTTQDVLNFLCPRSFFFCVTSRLEAGHRGVRRAALRAFFKDAQGGTKMSSLRQRGLQTAGILQGLLIGPDMIYPI